MVIFNRNTVININNISNVLNGKVKFLLLKLLSVKTIIVLTCLFLLSYQSYLIFMQYLQNNFLTNIKFIKNYVGSIPAVTILL